MSSQSILENRDFIDQQLATIKDTLGIDFLQTVKVSKLKGISYE